MSDVTDKTTRTITKGEYKMPSAEAVEAMDIGGLEGLQRASDLARVHMAKLSFDDPEGLVRIVVGSERVATPHGMVQRIEGTITSEAAHNLLEALLILRYRGCA